MQEISFPVCCAAVRSMTFRVSLAARFVVGSTYTLDGSTLVFESSFPQSLTLNVLRPDALAHLRRTQTWVY